MVIDSGMVGISLGYSKIDLQINDIKSINHNVERFQIIFLDDSTNNLAAIKKLKTFNNRSNLSTLATKALAQAQALPIP